jgi:hypothetical protein
LSPWRLLLERAIEGLDRFRAVRQPVPDWVLGGGTALMLHTGHRVSKDIDAFIDDPQYLSLLSPRLAGEAIWSCEAFEEAGNHLKLIYPEGEIDFIVAAPITDIPAQPITIEPGGARPVAPRLIDVEHPVETALKKLFYRASLLKVRDIFDIAVVDARFPAQLRENLPRVAHLKLAITERLTRVPEHFCRKEIKELAIADDWRVVADSCLQRVRKLASAIPP